MPGSYDLAGRRRTSSTLRPDGSAAERTYQDRGDHADQADHDASAHLMKGLAEAPDLSPELADVCTDARESRIHTVCEIVESPIGP
jgi:hypothetical protein